VAGRDEWVAIIESWLSHDLLVLLAAGPLADRRVYKPADMAAYLAAKIVITL
jgi:hypothetical protein